MDREWQEIFFVGLNDGIMTPKNYFVVSGTGFAYI
jgi:hypothetical protein